MQAAGRPQRRGWGVGDDRGRRGPGAALHGLGPDCASGSRSLKSNQGALYRSPAGQSTVPEPHGGMACRKWDGTEAHRVLVGEQRSGVYVSLAARTSARCSEDYVADGVRLRRLLQILPGACRGNRPSTTTPNAPPVGSMAARSPLGSSGTSSVIGSLFPSATHVRTDAVNDPEHSSLLFDPSRSRAPTRRSAFDRDTGNRGVEPPWRRHTPLASR